MDRRAFTSQAMGDRALGGYRLGDCIVCIVAALKRGVVGTSAQIGRAAGIDPQRRSNSSPKRVDAILRRLHDQGCCYVQSWSLAPAHGRRLEDVWLEVWADCTPPFGCDDAPKPQSLGDGADRTPPNVLLTGDQQRGQD